MSNANYRNHGLGTIDASAEIGTSLNPMHSIWTIPNLITLLRFIFTICFLCMYPIEQFHSLSIVLFIIAACTDWLDGKIARRLKQVSWFGKRFDPVMDRVLIFSGLIALTITDRLPLWVLGFLAFRDTALFVGGYCTMKSKGRIPDVCYVGKACTFILLVGFSFLLLDLVPVQGLGLVDTNLLPGFNSATSSLGIWAVYLGCILSLIAAIIYFARGIKILMGLIDEH